MGQVVLVRNDATVSKLKRQNGRMAYRVMNDGKSLWSDKKQRAVPTNGGGNSLRQRHYTGNVKDHW